MTYAHFYAANGSSIMQLLLRLRERYGDNWTDSMADYAIRKSCKVPGISWRVPSKDCLVKNEKIYFVQI